MNEFELNFSKKTITLLFILSLLTGMSNTACPNGQPETQQILDCIASIKVDGEFCRAAIIGGIEVAELFDDKTAYCCHTGGVYDSNPYFKKMPVAPGMCTVAISQCFGAFPDFPLLISHSTQDGNVSCSMAQYERCYRSSNVIEEPDFNVNFASSQGQPTNEPDCCMSECNELYSINAIGCGSDGTFYPNLSSFCNEFCYNKTLFLVQCGESFNGINCMNHQSCPSPCDQNALDQPSCGSNGILYPDKATLCQAFNDGVISSYDQCVADGGCDATQCVYNKCIQDLADLNYQGPQICGSSGMFYSTLDAFCSAMSQDNEYFFSLCDDGPCADQSSCCLRVCNNGNESFSTYCDNNFNFYSDKASYCDAFCSGNISEVLCGDGHCTQEGCCASQCVNTYPHDVCHRTTGQLWSAESMCESEGCSGNISILARQCFDGNDNVIPCTQVMCDVMSCDDAMMANGGERNICGNNGTSYPTIESYCNALHVTNTVTYEVLCDGISCQGESACCNAHCNEVTFAGGYQERCDVQYTQFLTKEAFCGQFCNAGSFDSLMCGNELCSLVECCQQDCANSQNFDVCDANFTLLTGTGNCQNNCAVNGGVIYDCGGQNCIQNDCDLFQCIHSTLADYPDNVCLKNNDGSYAYLTKEQACPMIVNGLSTPFMCNNCSNVDECANADCALQITIADAICDNTFNIYTDALQYCQANNNNLSLIQQCNNTFCDHRECCYNKCETEILTSACNKDHFYVMTKEERCDFRCGNQHIDREDLEVDKCYDANNNEVDCQDCNFFRCQFDFSGYAYNTVCINDNSVSSFYASVGAYCDFLIGGQNFDFNWNLSIPCSGGECADQDACCVSACELNQGPGFLEYCNLDGYSVVNLNTHCQGVCGIVNITSPFSCGNEDCELFDCKVQQCKAETNNTYNTICLETMFHGNFFYANLDNYCDVAVSQNEQSYDITLTDFACNGGECANMDDCCYYRCMTEAYIDSCSADAHGVIDHDAYCSHRCYNNVDRVNMTLDLCYDANGQQIACGDCAVFDCEDNIIALAYSFTTVCIDDNGSSLFFASYLSYCGHLVMNTMSYTIVNDNTCNGQGCTDATDCCFNVCMSQAYQPGCDSNFTFFNQTDYCTAHCGAGAPTLTLCGDQVCSEDVCYFRKCMDVIRPVYQEMCLKDSVNSTHFFLTKVDYCNAKVLAQETDFTNFDEIFCVNEGRCDTVQECCHYRCTETDYMPGCHTTLHHLVSEQEFCAFRCDTNSNPTGTDMALLHCSDGNGNAIPCTVNECSLHSCTDYLGDVNNYVGVGVCSTNDIFYNTHQAFCFATNGDMAMIRTCPDVNNQQVGCGNDDQCCMSNCLQMQNYTARCNSTDYIWRDTLLSYCENYCASDRMFHTYMDNDGNHATQAMCCSMRCVGDASSHHDVCNSGDFSLIDEVGSCQHLCEDPNGLGIISCPGRDCDMTDCNQFKCLQQLNNIMYVSNNVCGSDNMFYSREEYCIARENDNSIQLVLCGNSPCADQTACCQSNCVNNYIGPFTEMCDTNFNVYTNVEDYCAQKCANPNDPISPLQCDGNNCTLDECCDQRCMSEVYVPMCSPQPECELMDQATYCQNRCNEINFQPMTCENQPGGCTQQNCDYFECIFAVDLVHESNSVCGNNSILYNDETEYCTNKTLGNVDHFFLCEGGICNDQYDCCFHVCVEENQANYNPRCSSDFILHTTVQGFCNAKCSVTNYSDLMCGDMYCSAEQCCSLDCQNQPYEGHCDHLFNFLDHASYCDNDCAENGHGITNCPGGCDQQKCDLLKCENSLEQRPYDAICIDPAYQGLFFFASRTLYCETKIQANDHIFLVSGDVTCRDGNNDPIECAGEIECCVARCLQDYQYDICSTTYQIITPASFCSNKCNGTPITGARTCSDGQGNDINCTSCEQFRCADLTVNLTGTVCAPAAPSHFHINSSAFCNYVIGQSLDVQTMVTSIVLCDGINCDSHTCCVADCEVDNSSYINVCNMETYNIFTLRNHCNDQCAGTTTNTEGCGAGINCVNNDCLVKKCLLEANSSTAPGICMNNAQHLRHFFVDVNDFCSYLVANGIVSYNASSSLQCNGGTCTGTEDCCVWRCMEAVYVEGCSLNDYNLIQELEFCTYRCANNAHEALTYVDMDLFTCAANDLTQIPCDQGLCNMERCGQVFTGYNFAHICLSNAFSANYFFTSVQGYCTFMLGLPNPSYILPDFYTCNGGQNCADLDQCCFARCMEETYFVGCNPTSYTTVSHSLFCSHRCDPDNTNRNDMVLDTCGASTNCTSCEYFKCKDVIANVSDNICLYSFANIAYFYDTHTNYCNAKIAAGQLDYTLDASNSLDCGDSVNGCADSHSCCMAKCMNQTFFAVCHATNFILYSDHSNYCQDQCSNLPSQFDICTDGNGNQTACNLVSCCEFHVDSVNAFDPVCSSLGDLYANSFDFCTERVNNNSSLTELTCNGGVCNTETCHKEFCYNFSAEASLTFARCDNLYNHHVNVQSFCDAQFLNGSLSVLSACIGTNCNPVDCCILQCTDNPDNTSNDAVVVIDNGVTLIYNNACEAACQNSNPIVFTCVDITDHNACLTLYQNSCHIHCEMYQTHTETYCGNGVFYNAYQYCQAIECDALPNPPAWVVTPGCENNDCSADQCSYNQCNFACAGIAVNPVCGTNNVIYNNLCLLQCQNASVLFGSVSFVFNCNGLGQGLDCQTECNFTNCMNGCTPSALPVCGSNGLVHPSDCAATCRGFGVNFFCQESCSGNLRQSRCGFDCANGENPEL